MLYYAIGLYLLVINALAIAVFAHDKERAVVGGRRVRESDLLSIALIGGSLGMFWARQRFRHKTRKQPFGNRLEFVAMVQSGVAIGLLFVWLAA